METERSDGRFPHRSATRNAEGFTLIELLTVVAIIGIVAAIAIPQYASYKQSSADAGAKSDLRGLSTALEGYFTENETYVGATLPLLASTYGFRQTSSVTLVIDALDATHFEAHASASGGTGTHTYNSNDGQIVEP